MTIFGGNERGEITHIGGLSDAAPAQPTPLELLHTLAQRDEALAERDALKAKLGLAQSDLCDYENRDKAHIHSIDNLMGENAALTARVQALERSADVLLGELRQVPGPIFDSFNDTGRAALEDLDCVIYSVSPALDLSAHDEAVRREALEQAIERVMDVDCVCDLEGFQQMQIQTAIVAGIPPSTETPQEPK